MTNSVDPVETAPLKHDQSVFILKVYNILSII